MLMQSPVATNLRKMYLETNVDPLSSQKARQCVAHHSLHDTETYKIDMIHRLTDAKLGVAKVALILQDVGEILRAICCE